MSLRSIITSKFLLLLPVITFISCDPISGYIKIFQSLPVKVLDKTQMCSSPLAGFGTDNCDEDEGMSSDPVYKRKTISAGDYKAHISFQSKKKITLKVKSERYNYDEIDFNIPEGTYVPRYSGDINLTSSQSGQPFDISGVIDTQEEDSDTMYGTETCTYTKRVKVCRRVENNDNSEVRNNRGRGRRGPGNGEGRRRRGSRRVCEWEYQTVYGTQDVEYYMHYTTTTMSLDVLSKGGNSLLGKFDGSKHDSDKIYTYKGECI